MKFAYLLITLVAAIMFLLPSLVADAANNLAVNTSSNNTATNTAATWTEYENLTISTGAGNTTATLTISGKVNYSQAVMYGRIKRDGTVIESFNLTASTYPQTVTFVSPYTETAGTHYYAFEAYCTSGRLCTIYNRTFTVQQLGTNLLSPASYIITKCPWDTSYTCAENGTTRFTDYSGTNDSVLVKQVTDSMVNGGTIYFKSGTYTLTPSIPFYSGEAYTGILINYSNITITGDKTAVLKMASGSYGGGTVVAIIGTKDSVGNLTISGLTIDGNQGVGKATAGYNTGIFTYNAPNIDIIFNTFTDCQLCIYGDGQKSNFKILGNSFHPGASNNPSKAISLHNTPIKSIVSNNFVTGYTTGIWLDSSSFEIVSNNVILNRAANGAHGIDLFDDSNNNLISNNIIIGGGTASEVGVYVNTTTAGKPQSDNNTVRGNMIYSINGIGIDINGDFNKITDNDIYDTTTPINNINVSTIIKNNYGASPYNFGNNATAPVAFGAGDSYFNTTSKVMNYYNGATWIYANNTLVNDY